MQAAAAAQLSKDARHAAEHDILRTPDERLEGLAHWPYPPCCFDRDGMRVHYVDVGIGAAESVVVAAQTVATLAAQWRMVAAAIETTRLGAKAAITAAKDEAGARAAASRG